MPLRYVITKVTATGEQLTTEIAQCHPVTGDVMHDKAELDAMLIKATEASDERMFDMNMRMLDSYNFGRFFAEGEWIRVKQVMEVLAGRMQAQVLVHRWESAKEETAELERMRVEHARQPGLHDSMPLNEVPISTVVPAAEPVVTEKDVQAELQYPSVAENYYPIVREVEGR